MGKKICTYLLGSYAYFEATGVWPGSEALLFSPPLGHHYSKVHRCLTFDYFAFGEHVGSLRVVDAEQQHRFWELPQGMIIKCDVFYLFFLSLFSVNRADIKMLRQGTQQMSNFWV